MALGRGRGRFFSNKKFGCQIANFQIVLLFAKTNDFSKQNLQFLRLGAVHLDSHLLHLSQESPEGHNSSVDRSAPPSVHD